VDDFTLVTFSMNNVGYYSLYRLVITRNGGNDALTLSELQFFGTPGPTTLDKGSLTLGRSLDVPRVSRYDVDTETPRPEKLVLDLDTTVNSSPTDISGKGNHGTFEGAAEYSEADKAFTGFPSSSSNYIRGNLSGVSGAYAHTQSYWINGADTTPRCPFTVGKEAGNYSYLNIWLTTSKWVLNADGAAGGEWAETIYDNRWYHVVLTYDGGSSTSSYKLYINGEYKTPTTAISITTSLALPSNPEYRIGRNDGTQWYNGMVSNPKVYSVVLEPSEIRKLYNMGRTGRSMVISDTAVGIGKAPEAQLDVRGVIRGPGLSIQTVSSTKTDTSFFSGTSVTDIGGLSITIQPKFANSKIYVGYHILYGGWGRNFFRLKRTQGSSTSYFQSDLGPNDHASTGRATTTDAFGNDDASTRSGSFFTLDVANGLEPITYTVQGWTYHSVYYVCVNRGYREGNAGNETYHGRGASSITAQEVCQ
jgi:hypothetical protein